MLSKFLRPPISIVALLFAIAAAAISWVYKSHMQSTELVEITWRDFHKVYLIPNHETSQLEVHMVVQSGEADLTGIEGQAHYLEHLAWLSAIGSTQRPADRHTNAWTTSDATGYWMTGSSTDLGSLLATVLKALEQPKLDAKFAEAERGIVSREYDLSVRGDKYAQIEGALDKAVYQSTPYARSVIGVPSDIEKFSIKNALKIHQETHNQSNAVLVVSGPVSSKEVKAALAKVTFDAGNVSKSNAKTPAPLKAMYLTQNKTQRVDVDAAGLPAQLIWRKIVKLKEPVQMDLLEARVAFLHDILDTNLPGGIAKPLRFDAFIAESYQLSITALDEEYIEVRFAARPDKGVSLGQLKAAFEATLSKSAKDGIPNKTFERVLGRFETYWPKWDDPKKVADWLKNYTLARVGDRRTPMMPNALKELNAQLDLDSTNDLLVAIAGPGRVNFVEIGEQP
jgi:predicted Zn-dependent peptidase